MNPSFAHLYPIATAPQMDIAENSQPQTTEIDWNKHYSELKSKLLVGKRHQARIMKPVGAALLAIAAVFAKITFELSLSFTATPLVVIGVVCGAALLTFTVGAIGLYYLFGKAYSKDSPEKRIAAMKAFVEEIQTKKMPWDEVEKQIIEKGFIFSKTELDIIFFRHETSVTYTAFKERNGLRAVQQMTNERRNALKEALLSEVRGAKLGLNEIKVQYQSDLTFFGIELTSIWDSIKPYEISLGYNQLMARNHPVVAVISTLTKAEKDTVANYFLSESLNGMENLNNFSEMVKVCETLDNTSTCRAAVQQWFQTRSAGMLSTTTLPQLVTRFGLAVIDPLFLEANAPTTVSLIDDYIAKYDFSTAKKLYPLFERKMISAEQIKFFQNRFLSHLASVNKGLKSLKGEYKHLEALGVKDEHILGVIGAREVAYGCRAFIEYNGNHAYALLSVELKQKIRDSYVSEASTIMSVDDFIVGVKCIDVTYDHVMEMATKWFEIARTKVQSNFQALAIHCGKGVLNRRFLPVEDPRTIEMINKFLSDFHFERDWDLLNTLECNKIVGNDFIEQLKQKYIQYLVNINKGMLEIERYYGKQLPVWNIAYNSIFSSIAAREVKFGYSIFMVRNGHGYFEYLDDAQKNSLRASYLDEVVGSIRKLDEIVSVIERGKQIGLTEAQVMERVQVWFKTNSAAVAPSFTAFVDNYGPKVLDSRYIVPGEARTEQMVRDYLSTFDFDKDWPMFQTLCKQSLIPVQRINVVNTTEGLLRELHNSTQRDIKTAEQTLVNEEKMKNEIFQNAMTAIDREEIVSKFNLQNETNRLQRSLDELKKQRVQFVDERAKQLAVIRRQEELVAKAESERTKLEAQLSLIRVANSNVDLLRRKAEVERDQIERGIAAIHIEVSSASAKIKVESLRARLKRVDKVEADKVKQQQNYAELQRLAQELARLTSLINTAANDVQVARQNIDALSNRETKGLMAAINARQELNAAQQSLPAKIANHAQLIQSKNVVGARMAELQQEIEAIQKVPQIIVESRIILDRDLSSAETILQQALDKELDLAKLEASLRKLKEDIAQYTSVPAKLESHQVLLKAKEREVEQCKLTLKTTVQSTPAEEVVRHTLAKVDRGIKDLQDQCDTHVRLFQTITLPEFERRRKAAVEFHKDSLNALKVASETQIKGINSNYQRDRGALINKYKTSIC